MEIIMAEQQTNNLEADGSARGKFTGSSDGSKVRFAVGSEDPTPEAKPVAPVHKTGNVRHRIQIGADGVAGPLETNVAGHATRQSGPDPVKATAIGPQGNRISLSEAGPDTLIDLGGSLGSTEASVWESLNYIERDPSGRGYRVVGQQAPSAATTPAPVAPPQSPAVKPAEVNPADAVGVPPTSAASDAFQASMKETVFEQAVATLTAGQTPDWAEMGRLAGEREDFAPQAAALHGELLASGQRVLANVGVENNEAFEAWALKNKPEEANAAIRAMLARDVSKLAALGREYAANRMSRIESKVEAAVETKRENGVLYVFRGALGLPDSQGKGDFFGKSYISLAEAIRSGAIEISE